MFRSNHQRKVDDCYVLESNRADALPSKLSALTYYINSKPAKLSKVATYLKSKVYKDLYKRSLEYNLITLNILETIALNCSDYFSSFAGSYLYILNAFNSDTISKNAHVEARLHQLFITCCRLIKVVLPSIHDSGFYEIFTETLKKFLEDKKVERLDPNNELVAKTLQNAVIMEDFRGPFGSERLALIIHAIICSLRTFGDEDSDAFKDLHMDYENGDTKILNRNVTNPVAEPRKIVVYSLISLIENSNSTILPQILACIFKEFDDIKWCQSRLCRNVLKTLILLVPAQFLCLVLSEFLKKLEHVDDTVTVIIVDIITELLLSNRSPLGYSSIDLTRNFLKLIRKQHPPHLGDTRVSITESDVRPPRVIFCICNAFVALLRNATFALQKYEIIDTVISRTFFKDFKNSVGPQPDIGIARAAELLSLKEKHSIGTITLDSKEESHFRSVVWGILFSLAEESHQTCALNSTLGDSHLKLFESLFRMVRVLEGDFVLNTLVFWRQLLSNGLPIVPQGYIETLKTSASKTQSKPTGGYYGSQTIGRSSLYILSKSRLAISFLINNRDFTLNFLHATAIFSLVQFMCSQCDYQQLVVFFRFTIQTCKLFLHLPQFQDVEFRILTCLFTSKTIASIAVALKELASFNTNQVMKLTERIFNSIEKSGIPLLQMDDVLNSSKMCGFLDLAYDSEKTLVPGALVNDAEFMEALSATIGENVSPYDIQEDAQYVSDHKGFDASVGFPHASRSLTSSLGLASAESRKAGKAFSRLSRLATESHETAPPVYLPLERDNESHKPSSIKSSFEAAASASNNEELDPVSLTLGTGADMHFDQLTLQIRQAKRKSKFRSDILRNYRG